MDWGFLLGGVMVISATMLFLWLAWKLLFLVYGLYLDLKQYVFESNGPMLARIPLFFLWVPLAVFFAIVWIVAIIGTLGLIKDLMSNNN